MNCNDIDKALDEGVIAAPPSPEAQEHLNHCARCRKLVAALSLPVSDASPSSPRLRQIESGLVANLRPVHPLAAKQYFLVALAAIFLGVVALGVYRLGAFALAVMSAPQASVILGTLVVGAALLAYSLVNQMVPGSLHRIPPSTLPFAVALAFATATVLLFRFQQERHFWPAAWWCIRTGTEFGALAGVPLWFVLRRGAVLSPSVTGLATGLFAGLVGTTVLEIHCPILDAWHILLAHLGVAVFCALGGLVLGLAVENSQDRPHKRSNNVGKAVTS
jgi:hypothetical protein